MSAKYTSQKPDGYLNIRNNIFTEREQKQEVRTFAHSSALRNLQAQTSENYGHKGYDKKGYEK